MKPPVLCKYGTAAGEIEGTDVRIETIFQLTGEILPLPGCLRKPLREDAQEILSWVPCLSVKLHLAPTRPVVLPSYVFRYCLLASEIRVYATICGPVPFVVASHQESDLSLVVIQIFSR